MIVDSLTHSANNMMLLRISYIKKRKRLNNINRQRIEKVANETAISDPELAKELFGIEPIKKPILKTEIFALNQEASSLEDKLKKIK